MPDLPPSPLPLHDLLRARSPRATVTKWLIGANLLVFLAMLAGGAGLWHSSNGVQLAWGANFGPATQDGQWWRLGSAMFLHFGAFHLAMNMWALWDGGQLAERMYGAARFAVIYFASGLAGNLLSLVAHRGQAVSGGASGAIFGIYGALLIFVWRERRNLHRREFRWLFWAASGFSAATIVFGFLIPGIDNAAHIGGFLTGLLGGVMLLRPLDATQRVRWRGRLLAGGALALALAALIGHIPPPAYRWSEETLARHEIGQFLHDDAALGRAWQQILEDGKRGTSFEELAGRVDTTIGDRYEESFEQLSQIPLSPGLPSRATVETLLHYAEQRRDASRALADGLRANDPAQIRAAIEQARRSKQLAQPGADKPRNAKPAAGSKP
jgi:rhomboid protease GluP